MTRLDRVSRSVRDTLSIIEKLEAAGAGFRSLAESVETVSPAGRMLTTMLAAFAEFERASIRARTREGLTAARKRGVVLGRKPALSPEQRETVRHHVERADWTRAEAARMFGVDPATITRLMRTARTLGVDLPEGATPARRRGDRVRRRTFILGSAALCP